MGVHIYETWFKTRWASIFILALENSITHAILYKVGSFIINSSVYATMVDHSLTLCIFGLWILRKSDSLLTLLQFYFTLCNKMFQVFRKKVGYILCTRNVTQLFFSFFWKSFMYKSVAYNQDELLIKKMSFWVCI